MRWEVDSDKNTLTIHKSNGPNTIPLYSDEAFEFLSDQWLKVGWNQKHIYTFTWMGRPIIQLPEDLIRMQEVIYKIKPDVIIETGVAHGGSLIFYAGVLKAMNGGKVIGVDIEIRSHNRKAIESHELFPMITLIEGNSVAKDTVSKVKSYVKSSDRVLVILDSNHTRDHVLSELWAYADFVTHGSYIIATDGVMREVYDVPRGTPEWKTDNPCMAAQDFLKERKDFVLEQPAWLFNESSLKKNITHFPDAFLRKL